MPTLTAWKFESPTGADAVYDKMAPELEGIEAELISTNLSDDQEQTLRQAFGQES